MIDFSSSFVQPVLGHSAQPTGKNQLTKGDSGVMPRKTEEADSFEKQPQPPANRVEKNTVVPTVVATAILSPLLGALAGEWVWQGLASDEKKTITPKSTSTSDAGKGNGLKPPNVGEAEDKALQESMAKLSLLQKLITNLVPAKDLKPFISIENLSCDQVNAEIKTLLKTHHNDFTKGFILTLASQKLGDNASNAEYFKESLNLIEEIIKSQEASSDEAYKVDDAISTLHSEIAKKWQNYDMKYCYEQSPSGGLSQSQRQRNSVDFVRSLINVTKKNSKIDNLVFQKALKYGYHFKVNDNYPSGVFDYRFILESLESSDPNITFLNEQLQKFNSEFFEEIAQPKLEVSTPATDVSLTEIIEEAEVVASSTTQTVEASVKEGVQTLKGLGNWVLKPTETLEKAGGEALEKHATTSRWIAGGVALTTLVLGGAFAFFASQKKPQNQSANLNTSL